MSERVMLFIIIGIEQVMTRSKFDRVIFQLKQERIKEAGEILA